MSKLIGNIQTFVFAKAEELSGALAGAGTGTYLMSEIIKDLFIAIIFAFFTGFVGALGGHLYKVIIAKLKKGSPPETPSN